MLASLRWLSDLLDPSGLDSTQAEALLTSAGFPLESVEPLPSGDARLDVEVTSNRGDCLSHVGLAREIAAATTRALRLPTWDHPVPGSTPVDAALTLENDEPDACPLFTAQVIRGVRVGPSPAWLVERLEAVGQRSINNVVDVTNFVSFELGHPSHVFDLDRLAGATLRVRFAEPGETLTTLDRKSRVLALSDLVVADAERAQSLAGVIGGEPTEVTAATTNVVLEMATWDPVVVRTTARRLGLRTDASHRFERGVAPGEIAFAAARAAALIVQVAGGQLCQGVLEDGAEIPEPVTIPYRPARARQVLGIEVSDAEQLDLLARLGVTSNPQSTGAPAIIECSIPGHRLDLAREIDLVEEVARLVGLDRIPIDAKVTTAVRRPQDAERAERLLSQTLAGLGFFEAVTFSFIAEQAAEAWMPRGLRALRVDDERRGSEPVLRPSALPSLLACRRANQHARAEQPGGVRLFELSANFAEFDQPGRRHVEHRNLALLMDVPVARRGRPSHDELQLGLRHMRGVIDALAEALGRAAHRVAVTPGATYCSAFQPEGFAEVAIDEQRVGSFGLVAPGEAARHDLELPVVAADLNLAALLALHPGRAGIAPLPHFPPIDRDLTLDLPEQIRWADVHHAVGALALADLELVEFVGVYRGKPVEPGRKSLTLRMRFRDATRTLRREEADPQVAAVVADAAQRFGAVVRQ